jgi:hypothetical protein
MENHPMENQEDPLSSNLPICLLAVVAGGRIWTLDHLDPSSGILGLF